MAASLVVVKDTILPNGQRVLVIRLDNCATVTPETRQRLRAKYSTPEGPIAAIELDPNRSRDTLIITVRANQDNTPITTSERDRLLLQLSSDC